MGWKRQRKGGEAGYTLALVMVMASVLLVTLSEAVLNWQTAVKREREEELIFRGKQYQRALVLWYAHWSRTLGTPQVAYPSTVEALLNTNNKRFLRKEWTDPITDEEWRFIKVGPNNRPLLTVLPGTAAAARRRGVETLTDPAGRASPRDRARRRLPPPGRRLMGRPSRLNP